MFKAVLFDLDGTLTDSAEGITKSVQYALQHFGIEVEDYNELRCFVGPSLYDQFESYAHMTKEQAVEAVHKFRERFSSIGIYENAVYERVEDALKLLKQRGVTLAIASAKPQVFVHQVLQHFHIEQYFDVIVGSELNGERAQKSEVITEVLRQLQLEDTPYEALMVGDRSQDMKGASACGLSSLGVAYGYGGRSELEQSGADYIVDSVEQMIHFFSMDVKPKTQEERYVEHVRQQGLGFKVWRALYPIVIHMGTAVVVTMIGSMIIMAMMIRSSAGLNLESYEYQVLRASLLFTGIGEIVALPLLVHFFKKDAYLRNGIPKKPLIRGTKGISIPMWIAFYVFAAALGMGISNLIDLSGIPQLFPGYSELTAQVFENQKLWLSILTVGILAPIVEELVFRGLIYKRIKDYKGVKAGIIVSALLFGLYHGNVVQFIFAFLLGMVMAIFYERTQTLWVPIILHIGVNMTSTLLSEFMTGYGSIGIYLASVIIEIIVSIVLGIWLWKRTRRQEDKEIQNVSM